MRVLWLLSGLAMGGGERNIVSVLPYLKQWGLEVALCTLNTRRDGPLAEVFAQTGLQRHDLAARRMTDPAAWRRLAQLLTALRIDLLHAQDQDSIVYAALSRRLLGVPAVMTRHVLDEPSSSWKEAVRARLVLAAARHGIDRVVAVSESVRLHFAELGHIPLSKVETVYNGIDLHRFTGLGSRDALRADLGWEPRRPIAIFVSVMRPGKGFELLFEAIPAIRSTVPDLQVKIVGTGPLEPELREQARPLGDAVEFLGERMDIPQLLGASDLLIQASWSEALPTVLIEAAAAGIPVVATDVGGSREIIHDGQAGFLIAAGDAAALASRTVHLLQDRARAVRMGSYAQDFARRTFSLPQQAEHLSALYKRVLHVRHEDLV